MKAIEALECMKDGTKVALYYPDCEMFELSETNMVSLSFPDYSNYVSETMPIAMFLQYYPNAEFVLYEKNKQKT